MTSSVRDASLQRLDDGSAGYQSFLASKIPQAPDAGFHVEPGEIKIEWTDATWNPGARRACPLRANARVRP
ncbi:MAG: hypothetical protein WD118_08830 [Phycisphaeraceae bacterium]